MPNEQTTAAPHPHIILITGNMVAGKSTAAQIWQHLPQASLPSENPENSLAGYATEEG